jgi:hypothetical protein
MNFLSFLINQNFLLVINIGLLVRLCRLIANHIIEACSAHDFFADALTALIPCQILHQLCLLLSFVLLVLKFVLCHKLLIEIRV